MLIEVTDAKEIKQAQSKMFAGLKGQFPYVQERIIGWPAGHFSARVRFSRKGREDTSWWYSGLSPDKRSAYNLFGRGNPKESKTLLIDLQFNIPVATFNRKQGGAFVRDLVNGKILLAHRGIVTRGKSRVPRKLLLQEANVELLTIASDKSPNKVDIFLVAPIDDADLGNQIGEFANEIRRAANLVMSDHKINSAPNAKIRKYRSTAKRPSLDSLIAGCFDEFIGKTVIHRSAQVTMNCRHDSVVKELRNQLESVGAHYKSVAMDLVVETEKKVFLYEVKTSSDSQSIYTGIGQLYFHAAALKKIFQGKEIVRHLVIPVEPATHRRAAVLTELGIKIVTFNISSQKVTLTSGP